MSDDLTHSIRPDPKSLGGQIDAVCDRFDALLRAGSTVRLDDFLDCVPEAARRDLLRELIALEVEYRLKAEQRPDPEEYRGRFPDYPDEIQAAFGTVSRAHLTQIHVPKRPAEPPKALKIRCPHCRNPIELVEDKPLSEVVCPSCGSSFGVVGDEALAHRTQGGTLRRRQQFGHFELLEQLGAGAFGAVWKARDTQLDRIVALKIPRRGQLTEEEAEKFIREARAAAQLRHPNIISVHEVGREGDTLYIVSDFVEGLTLADTLTAQKLGYREAAELCAKIAEALDYAHERGVIHRDLKPSNILIDRSGEPCLMDFGLAKRESGEITMTVEGEILGTPAYMSPEQARGEGHTVDRRTDVYSLGAMLFELLTGECPFRGNVRMLLKQVVEDNPPRPRKLDANVPRDLETICLKCLEKSPGSRYSTAKELAEEFKRFLRGEPIRSRPIPQVTRIMRWCKRRPLIASLSVGIVLAFFVGTRVSTILSDRIGLDAHSDLEEGAPSSLTAKINATQLAPVRRGEVVGRTDVDATEGRDTSPCDYKLTYAPPVYSPPAITVFGEAGVPCPVVFIFDCSASMLQSISDTRGLRKKPGQHQPAAAAKTARFAVARDALKAILERLAKSEIPFEVGLVVYGHRVGWEWDPARRKNITVVWDPKNPGKTIFKPEDNPLLTAEDVEVLRSPSPFGKQELARVTTDLGALRPIGETPLYLAIKTALEELRSKQPSNQTNRAARRHIVAITDGINEATGEVTKEGNHVFKDDLSRLFLSPENRDITLDIVGFNLTDWDLLWEAVRRRGEVEGKAKLADSLQALETKGDVLAEDAAVRVDSSLKLRNQLGTLQRSRDELKDLVKDTKRAEAGSRAEGTASKGFYQVDEASGISEVVKVLGESLQLRKAKYTVERVSDTAVVGTAELNESVTLERHAGVNRYLVKVKEGERQAKTEVTLEGGESEMLFLSKDGTRLEHRRYDTNLRVSRDGIRDPSDPENLAKRFFIGAHRPVWMGKAVSFEISIQNNDPKEFSARPEEGWVEVRPVVPERIAARSPYIVYDLKYVERVPVPVLTFTAPNWPPEAEEAEIQLWFKLKKTPPDPQQVVTVNELRNRGGFQLQDVPTATFTVETRPGKPGAPLQVVVSERYAPGKPILGVRVEMDPMPEHIIRQYNQKAGTVHHTFSYYAAMVPQAGTFRILFTPHSRLRDRAVALPAPLKVGRGRRTNNTVDVVVNRVLDFAGPKMVRADYINGSAWSVPASDVFCDAFPNRTTEYLVSLVNRSREEKNVAVELWAPPPGPVDPTTPLLGPLDRLGRPLPGYRRLALAYDLALDASETPTSVPFVEIKTEAKKTGAEEAEMPAKKEAKKGTAASEQPFVSRGLACVIYDLRARDPKPAPQVRWLRFRPVAPRGYLNPAVKYEQGRITVQVEPLERQLLPRLSDETPIKIDCDVRGTTDPTSRMSTHAEITAPDQMRELFVDVPPRRGGEVLVQLTVDGYPRAFLFRAPTDRPQRIEELRDLRDVRIVAPRPGEAYRIPLTAPIFTEFEIDAPADAFRNWGAEKPRDVIEVTMEVRGERSFVMQDRWQFCSDRQFEARVREIGAAGLLKIDAQVHDFKVPLSPGELKNAEVAVRVTMSMTSDGVPGAGPDVKTAAVRVIFDAAKPTVKLIEAPRVPVTQGNDTTVILQAADGRGSGVAKIECGLHEGDSTELEEKDKLAVVTPPNIQEHTKILLPTKDLKPGKYAILARVTDGVDWKTAMRLGFLAIAERSPSLKPDVPKTATLSSISGRAVVGDLKTDIVWIGLEISLKELNRTVKGDSGGGFKVPDVPHGQYTLEGSGICGNKVVKGSVRVTVTDKPATVNLQME